MQGLGLRVLWLRDVRAYLNLPKPTFCRVPINSILGFVTRVYKNVGLGRRLR